LAGSTEENHALFEQEAEIRTLDISITKEFRRETWLNKEGAGKTTLFLLNQQRCLLFSIGTK
jgi:hypothetical protein